MQEPGMVTNVGVDLFPIIGNLRDHFLPEVLFQIYESRQTGTLVFAQGDFKKALVFEQGEIVFASSNQKEDSLGEALVRSGKISLMDFSEAEMKMNNEIRMGEVLIGMGSIDENDLMQGLIYQMH